MQRTYYIYMEFISPDPYHLTLLPIRVRCAEFEIIGELVQCKDAYVSVVRSDGPDKETDRIPMYYYSLKYMNSMRVSEVDWPA